MNIIRAAGRLYLIQIFAFCAVSLGTFFPGLDLLLSLLYIIVLIAEGRLNSGITPYQKSWVVFLWQGPALFMSIYVLAEFTFANLDDYAIFALQFWTAPLLPWWSLLNAPTPGSYPLYYYYVLASPLLFSIVYLAASIKKSVDDSIEPPTDIHKNQQQKQY
ncbi:MAG: hypothetical protein ABRQ26_08605 [Syntrophomonadaceae bacterium]